jgi:cation diffusion facilitator CzcD-associated flavoprotein CzcO
MSNNPTSAIIGAGIGGLAPAAALLNWIYGYDLRL